MYWKSQSKNQIMAMYIFSTLAIVKNTKTESRSNKDVSSN